VTALRCLVVDDQPATLDQLARMLRAQPSVARVSTAAGSTGALRMLHHTDVDVAFIEARMPGMDGVELAWLLKRFRAAPAVVFVTTHPGHAAEAFDLGAVDYLSKPPPQHRLAETLRRVAAVRHAERILHPDGATARTEVAAPAAAGAAPAVPAARDTDEVIPVVLGGTTKLVWRSTVRWVEARGDYARLHTADGSHLIRARLAALADCWQAAGLVRIHRSYLVQLGYVTDARTADTGRLTVVVNGRRLPVSRRMAPALRDQLLDAGRRARA
jgi:DNA-binding LytR/AlgR family response regulator